MKDTNCIFCKILEGELPSTKIYEDEHVYAFLDITPVNPGHTLVIPKAHYENMFAVPEDMVLEMMRAVKKIAHGIKDGLGVGSMNVVMNNGVHADQTVFHSHIHLIPRHEHDGHPAWKGAPYKDGQAAEIAEQIKKAL